MYKYDKEFDYFLKKFGKPQKCKSYDEQTIATYRHKLPEQLFKYWRELGWCAYGDGLVWMVNPAEYEEILRDWLAGTIFENRNDLSVVARNAFGELYVWAKGKGKIITTNTHLNLIYYYRERDEVDFTNEEEQKKMRRYWALLNKEFLDYQDDNDPDDLKFKHGLFDRALEKLGPLEFDEMYGFKQHHYLGGKYLIENVEKYKTEIYYDIAKQLKEVEVIVI